MMTRLSPEVRESLRELLKRVYFTIPAGYRQRVVSALFRVPVFRRLLSPLVSQNFYESGGRDKRTAGSDSSIYQNGTHQSHSLPKSTVFRANGLVPNCIGVGVAIHAYYPELLPDILRKLRNIPCSFQLYITTHEVNRDEVEQAVSVAGLSATVIDVENIGYDLLPFINLIPQFIDDGVAVVCKLHTKKGSANLEVTYPGIEPVWSNLLINPILSSQETVTDILQAFERYPGLAMVGSASLYKSAEDLMYGNERDVLRILRNLGVEAHSRPNWGFFAGSMFWCRVDTLRPLARLLETKENLPGTGKSSTGKVASYWHALERTLGILPGLANGSVGLSFASDAEGSTYVLSILDSQQQAAFASPYSVGLTLATEFSLRQDLRQLQQHCGKSASAPLAVNDLGIDPILFYLRYGLFLGQELLDCFNSQAYWLTYRDVFEKRLNPLVHYLIAGRDEGRAAFPAKVNIEAACSCVEQAKLFDRGYYLAENTDVAVATKDLLRHFCEVGWLELRDPCPGFDVWNYWQEKLNPRAAAINPAVHRAIMREHELYPERGKIRLSEGHRFEEGQKIRRICLFAGYDPDEQIDQTVIDYVTELSRFSDVFYLSDGQMPKSELKKLCGITKGAWSIHHQAYDFGSYAKLAIDLVGWDQIQLYDELILANDSCYLLRPFDHVFEKMSRSRCDWWGLQATKGVARTRWKSSNRFSRNIPLSEVKANKLDEYENEEFYDFLIASYFLVFRPPVILGPELKWLLQSVQPERNKLNVIRKYEIGLTRRLINAGYNFDTFIDELFTFHPVFTDNHFQLIKEGFPLFKRFLLTENHYHVPDLWRWQERLLAEIPGLDLAPIKSNLQRVSNPEKLHRNLHIRAVWGKQFAYPKVLSNVAFAWRDRWVRKEDNWWAFPVCAYDHELTGNDRAVFESVKNDPAIKKIVLVRDKHVAVDGNNVEVVPLNSREGQDLLLRCKVVFVKHTIQENIGFPLNSSKRHVINLWHGIPLKRIGYVAHDLQHRLERLMHVHTQFRAVVCSSDIDRLAMASAFYPLTFKEMWLTGLPRNDFILRNESDLPPDMVRELRLLEEKLEGRRLVLFCPTFRKNPSTGYYLFSREEIGQLKRWIVENNLVLGIREHAAASVGTYLAHLSDLPVLDLGVGRFKNVELLYRKAAILLTDYSSCFIDFMLTGKPVISFAYDHAKYSDRERGLFYDLNLAVPGAVCTTFAQLMEALRSLSDNDWMEISPELYEFKCSLFHKYKDGRNTERLVEKVKDLTNFS